MRYTSSLKLTKESEMKKSSVSIFPFVAVIKYTLDFVKRLPYEQRYLSCMTFSVYEVVRVTACLEELSQNCAQRDQEQKLDLLKVAHLSLRQFCFRVLLDLVLVKTVTLSPH